MVELLSPALREENSQIKKNVLSILEARYLRKDDNGNIIETPTEMFKRVATAIAQAESDKEQAVFWANEFFNLMVSNRFLPNSPTLMNAGTGAGTLSACFVIGVEDDMESILYASRKAGMVLKFGGGVGYSLGKLRSKGSSIRSTHGKACGPIRVLRFYNETSRMITQGGKRDGANMAILPISHPDIREFIHCKDGNIGASKDNQVLSEFNISIAITDEFLQRVDRNEPFDLTDPHTGKVTSTVNAKELFSEIVKSAHATGDPGLFYVDTVNRLNQTPNLGRIESTNPCGEVPLYPEEACNLGSINLPEFIIFKNGKSGQKDINWEGLKETTRIAVRFLDNVVTVNKFPLAEIRTAVNKTRKLGLGVMGWADLLFLLEIPYDSQRAVDLAEKVMSVIQITGHEESVKLARERGCFEAWEGSVYEKAGIPMRNATVTCIAPTGTISRIAGAYSGIEPVFAFVTESKILQGQITEKIIDSHPIFETHFKNHPRWDDIVKHISDGGSLQDLPFISQQDKALFKTTNEISVDWHVKHQAAFQKYTDLAVSKTINLPNSATVEDVERAYKLAHSLDCKGVTIYRDGSRSFQVLNKGTGNTPSVEKIRTNGHNPSNGKTTTDKIEIEIDPTLDEPQIVKSASSLGWKAAGVRYKIPTPIGPDCLVHINTDEQGRAREIVINIGKAGTDIQADAEALGRIATQALKYGTPLAELHTQLSGISSGRVQFFRGAEIRSLADAAAFAIRDFINDPEVTTNNDNGLVGIYDFCPDCNNKMILEEGCMKCVNPQCGFSKC